MYSIRGTHQYAQEGIERRWRSRYGKGKHVKVAGFAATQDLLAKRGAVLVASRAADAFSRTCLCGVPRFLPFADPQTPAFQRARVGIVVGLEIKPVWRKGEQGGGK